MNQAANIFDTHIHNLQGSYEFEWFTNKNNSNFCILTIWLLELNSKLTKTTTTRIIWGLITKSSTSENRPNNWIKKEEKWSAYNKEEIRYRHVCLSLTSTCTSIEVLLKFLGKGHSFESSTQSAQLPPPPSSGQLQLGSNSNEISEKYASVPIIFLPHNHNQSQLTSLSKHSTFSSAISLLNKQDIFNHPNTSNLLTNNVEIAKDSLTYLEVETGLKFCSVDGRRVGNIEWIASPFTDFYEKDYIDIKFYPHEISVTILAGILDSNENVTFRLRTYIDNDIILDNLYLTKPEQTTSINTNSNISRYTITIWKMTNNACASILYETDNYLMKHISFNIGIMGANVDYSTPWSKRVEKNKRESTRIENLRKITQTSYEKPIHIGDTSALEESNNNAEELIKDIFPIQSGAKFFEKGWFSNGGIDFVTWLSELTKNNNTKELIIIDPFFDDVGITEFFARATVSSTKYIAITNSLLSSYDDTNSSNVKSLRRDRIIDAFNRVKPIVEALNISVIDINKYINKTPSSEQIFHDRYLILYDSNLTPTNGFHLSNSIQGATKNSPLLITIIPSDILPKVSSYVNALRTANGVALNLGGDLRVEEIISTRSAPSKNRTNKLRPFIINAGFFREIFGDRKKALLWSPPHDTCAKLAFEIFEQKFQGSHEDDWYDAENILTLQHAELMDQSHKLIIDDEIYENLPQFFNSIASDQMRFKQWWESFCHLCYHMPMNKYNDVLKELPSSSSLITMWTNFINVLLKEKLSTSIEIETARDILTGIVYLTDNFIDALEYYNRIPDYYSSTANIMVTLEFISQNNPILLIKITEDHVDTLKKNRLNNDFTKTYTYMISRSILSIIINIFSCKFFSNDDFINRMLVSPIAIFRAIASNSIFDKNSIYFNRFDLLEKLNNHDRLALLTKIVYNLRIESNQNNGIINEDINRKLLPVCQLIVETHPNSISLDELIRRCGGPSIGSWSISTLNNILIPLKEKGTISACDIIKAFGELLLNKIKTPESGIIYFYRPSDADLTEAFAITLNYTGVDAESPNHWIDKITKIGKTAIKTINKPFIQSLNYEKWANSIDQIMWVYITINLILYHDKSSIKFDFLNNERKTYKNILINLSNSHNDELRKFSEVVDNALLNKTLFMCPL
jgi:hypothetical protein